MEAFYSAGGTELPDSVVLAAHCAWEAKSFHLKDHPDSSSNTDGAGWRD